MLFYTSVRQFTDALKNQRIEDMENILSRVSANLDLSVSGAQRLCTSAAQLPQLQQTEKDTDITDALAEFASAHAGLVRVMYFVRFSDGKVLSSQQLFYDVIHAQNGYDMPSVLASALSGTRVSVSEPYYSSLITGRTIAFSRAVLDHEKRIIGAVMFETGIAELVDQLIPQIGFKQVYIAILSALGREIHVDAEAAGMRDMWGEKTTDSSQMVAALSGTRIGWNSLQGGAGHWYSIFKQRVSGVRWTLYAVMDDSALFASVPELILGLGLTSLAFLLALSLVLALVTRSITRPIRDLAGQMSAVRTDDDDVPHTVPLKRMDEIGDLSRSFHQMLERTRGLIERQRLLQAQRHEMDLKVLQSQVSPHFLYNALNAIASLAQQNNVGDIPRCTASLIKLLAVSMDKTSEFITLGEELSVLRDYLAIQRMRFGDVFEVIIYVPDELCGCMVPKLILQPLVENSIFHGFAKTDHAGRVIVEAIAENGELILTVTDNGIGMEQRLIDRLLSDAADTHYSNDRLHSIGIAHVNQRIRLHYGPSYGLFIVSELGVGTKATLVLAYRTREDGGIA
ncbi:hypothetical protein FACS1894184_13400 [Clostridia bacterium]|nr:hypothetical protein FACS1894184_13400 [Clostridia bacterium]